jgi:predicted transcriptional regulator
MTAQPLARRERQILDILHRRGRATAQEVLADLPDPPSYSAIRALLKILVEKGHARHQADGPRYVYSPAEAPAKAKKAALRHLLDTFFEGSAELAVTALLDSRERKLTPEQLDRLAERIEAARKQGERE